MLRYAEIALAALAFIILSGSSIHYPLLGVPVDVPTEELKAFEGQVRDTYLYMYLITVGLAVLNWRKMLLGSFAVWPIVLLIVIVWLSISWSVDPERTQRRAIALTITTLFGIYLFVRFDFKDLLRFLTYCYALLIVMSFVYVAIFPIYAIHQDGDHAGAIRGLFFHKNNFGRHMSFALAILLAAWYARAVPKGFLGLIMVLAVLGTVVSTSKTALISLFVLAPGLIAVHMVRGAPVRSAVITLTVLAIAWHAALLLYFTYEEILLFFGRDPTLTGRTELWAFAMQYGLKAPLTGWGYDAFWEGDKSPGLPYALSWGLAQAHNAWLEVFVSLGLPAVLLTLGIILTMTFRGIILGRYYPERGPAVLIILIVFLFFTVGISEAMFLQRHTSFWIVFVVVAGVGRALTAELSSKRKWAPDESRTTGDQNAWEARPI